MARIPNFLSEPSRGGLPSSGAPSYASPEAFGAGIGEAQARGGAEVGAAVHQLGQATVGLGVAAGDYEQARQKKIEESQTANGVANFDFTGTYLDLQKTPPPDGLTYQQVVGQKYDENVTAYVDKIPDENVRAKVKLQLMSQKPQYVNSAATFQNREAIVADKSAADSGLNLQYNRVAADGSIDTWNDAQTKGNGVIDARPNLTPADKELMKKKFGETLAMRRFDGLIRGAYTDPDALASLETELTAPESVWKGRMSDEAYNQVLDKITTLKKAANSQDSSAARAGLQTLTQRNEAGELIDPTEMSAIQDTVTKSKNPALISQFAMINRAQQIYRENKGLPLEQQREKIEELHKRGGITGLPDPVKQGITEGAQLTGGAISQEYLAGLVGIEYGKYLGTGDYGKGTDNGASDALGVAQFTTPTWRSVLRAHASELGIDAKASDATLDAMRKDPVLSIKAAALHAKDNKVAMEASLGRPMNDGDLYFAHLLGQAGAIKFLSGAQQDPNAKASKYVAADQVAANHAVFYDETGRERSAAQVRSYIANATLNSLSRADYAGVKAATLVYNNTVKGLKDDPVTFAGTTGRFGDVGNVASAEGMARRGVVAQQIAEYYSVPAKDFKPFTKDEAEALAKKARDGTSDETLQVMQQVGALGSPDMVRAGNKQIGEKDTMFGYAASLAQTMPDKFGVAADIIRGEKRMKADKDVLNFGGTTEADIQNTFNSVVGKALIGDEKMSTATRQAALAYYIERHVSRGGAKVGSFDTALFKDSVQTVLGGTPNAPAVDNVNGVPMLLPRGVDRQTFAQALRNMTPADYVANAKWGSAPRYADGSVVSPQEISNSGKFESIGGGEYKIKMGDGKYALSAAYKDGSADAYIFRPNADLLRTYAQRQSAIVVPNTPMLP